MASDADICDQLVEHVPAMRAFARSLTRDHSRADDLVQEAILKAKSNLDKFQAGANLRAWLFTILRNTFYSLTRKRKWEVEDVDGAHAARLSQKPEHDGVIALADFKSTLATLPVDQREALTLVGASGLSHEEAAEISGCAVGTVKSRVNRARKRLTELLYLKDEDAGETSALTLATMAATPTIWFLLGVRTAWVIGLSQQIQFFAPYWQCDPPYVPALPALRSAGQLSPNQWNPLGGPALTSHKRRRSKCPS